MSTDDCKKFIQSIAQANGFDANEKWKRTKKYRQQDLTLREFENSTGATLVIAQDKTGALSLHHIDHDHHSLACQALSQETLLAALWKLLVDASRQDKSFRQEIDEFTQQDGSVSERAILAYHDSGDDSLLKADIKAIKLKNNQDIELVAAIIRAMEDGRYEKPSFFTDLAPEKVGVLYDTENIYAHYHEKEGISCILLECGGDWEHHVLMYVYWSDKEQRLKGFFPTGEGNVYNQETHTAYGSEQEKLSKNLPNYEKLLEKYESIHEKIYYNAKPYYDKAKKLAFKQFKQHLLSEERTYSPQ